MRPKFITGKWGKRRLKRKRIFALNQFSSNFAPLKTGMIHLLIPIAIK